MTRTQSIAIIKETLASLDDEDVAGVAAFVQSMGHPLDSRRLTSEELAGIERSKADFRAGRTYSPEEARALSEAIVAPHAAPFGRKIRRKNCQKSCQKSWMRQVRLSKSFLYQLDDLLAQGEAKFGASVADDKLARVYDTINNTSPSATVASRNPSNARISARWRSAVRSVSTIGTVSMSSCANTSATRPGSSSKAVRGNLPWLLK